jgi:hypothetical protein
MPASQAEMQDIELASIRQELTERFYTLGETGRPRPAMAPFRVLAKVIALPQSCPRDAARSYFCGGSGDAVGRHLTQTFNFAGCSHRVSALDCARDIAKTREATP